ncbi:putative exodeoxyribonuclease V [Sinorhizobium phage phiM7]|uniref:Putative exodeoxyribonuclease V n=2 Tax=Emdodecavirus TaxID=1980937 RepID=S5MQ98_9CAUD|nr:Dda-like helicase [Sinorhizobium phage phiM12]YP_009601411.1 Dda-like helicase [Sinorhizobium phage phiM7]AGR48005.1 putative exodeoxyribonuclease V [Sinorhizobium phage phiM12]AKF12831.1 putative exodeoxyribonuclease V [Sinorhizobium phage phiM7]AKF13191.1 putative exodeoxyribonuclease V [Sinorhizobium phage phiM19]
MTFELTTHQQEAADLTKQWFKYKEHHYENPIFRLFGYAGTGKTTITNKIIEQLDLTMGEDVKFAAYTGKAAMVMRRNLLPASTIHSMIYHVVEADEKAVEKLRQQLHDPYVSEFERGRIRAELNEISKPRFQLRERGDPSLKGVKLLVLDECSMVNAEMLLDLFTFEIPMLVLGDPGQLPPIEGRSPLTDVRPDAMLTEIHRQAEGNPIIYLATRARKGYDLKLGEYANSRVISKRSLTQGMMKSFDQILVGKNTTRREINERMRDIRGFTGRYPQVGEKLICLRNNPEFGLFNGMICYVEEVGFGDKLSIELKIRRETDAEGDPPTSVYALRAHFDMYDNEHAMDNVKLGDRLSVNEFDFGYSITVHKAQGSAWNNVCLIDDGMFAGWGKQGDRERWLYTGITRACDTLTIAV